MPSSKIIHTERGPVPEAEPSGTGELLRKAILHIDCNCFFVSCERLRDPKLKDKTIIVGGSPGNIRRGIVSCASYEARKYGVHAGMSLAKAKRLCPEAMILPGDFALYAECSEKLIRVLKQFSDKVEQASIDEAYVDLTGYAQMWLCPVPEGTPAGVGLCPVPEGTPAGVGLCPVPEATPAGVGLCPVPKGTPAGVGLCPVPEATPAGVGLCPVPKGTPAGVGLCPVPKGTPAGVGLCPVPETEPSGTGGTYLNVLVEIQKAIDTIIGIPVSLGLADNKVTAKIAAGIKKPGITVVPSDETRGFLGSLPIGEFPGIGPAISKELRSIGIHTIGELQWWTYPEMKNYFGAYGDYLYLAINGLDDRKVHEGTELPLSISKEHTFAYDQVDHEQVFLKLRFLAAKVFWRLRKYELHAREVRLKIRFADFSDFTKTHVLPDFMSLDQDIMPIVRSLFEKATKDSKKSIRLVGVGVGRLEKIESKALFTSAKASPLQKAVDELNERYHELTILYGV